MYEGFYFCGFCKEVDPTSNETDIVVNSSSITLTNSSGTSSKNKAIGSIDNFGENIGYGHKNGHRGRGLL